MDAHGVRIELAALWQAALERVQGSLLASSARSTDAEAPALRQLQQLRRFLFADSAAALHLAETAPEQLQAGVAQLCDLLQCQASLPGRTEASAIAGGTALVQQQLRRALLHVVQACRHSEWTLSYYVASGLAAQCRELRLLGCFSGSAETSRQLARIEQQLILWHAATQAPAPCAVARMQQQVLALLRGKPAPCALLLGGLPEVGEVPALSLDAQVLQELSQLVARLQPAVQAQVAVSESMMIACYRLTWVLQALGSVSLADAGNLLYQLLVRHWQQRQPMSAALRALLEGWLALLPVQLPWQGAAIDIDFLLPCMSAALSLWPDSTEEQAVAVQLGGAAMSQRQDLSMRQVPEHMAASLQSLLQVQASWFADRSSWERCQPRLWPELQLLEQGAAALRLSALESFVSQLLAFHVQLALQLPGRDWPAATLWHAHRELVATLDRAALWQEPLPAAEAQLALHAGLQRGEEFLQAAAHAGAALHPGLRLAAALSLFGQQAARLLGRSVRVRLATLELPPAAMVDLGQALENRAAAALDCALPRALHECLRWLLLQPDSSAEARRSRRLPQASAISVTVQEGAVGIVLSLQEQAAVGLPGEKALQRLQRSLGPAVQQLRCEEVQPQGRRLALYLAMPKPRPN